MMHCKAISIITLIVNDLAKAATFYQEGLGLIRAKKPLDAMYFKLQGTWLALCEKEAFANYAKVSINDLNGRGSSTLSCNVKYQKEVDPLIEQALAAGGVLVKAPTHFSWGGYGGWIADLDGHLWEIIWNPHWPATDD